MSDTKDQVFAKISKLLALSRGRGTTEAEAALAAEHVQRMLQEHNLSLSEVEAKGQVSEGGPREKTTTAGDRRAMYSWQVKLMAALAGNHFCLHDTRVVYTPRPNGQSDRRETRHLLVGRRVNVEVTLSLYDYLVEAIRHLREEQFPNTDQVARTRFNEGAAAKLDERLYEKRRQAERESAARNANSNGSGRELALTDVYGSERDLNNDALYGFPPGTTAAKRMENERRRAEREAEETRLKAEGVDATVAFYRAYGYGEERSAELAQKWKRKSARAYRSTGYNRSTNWTRRQDREWQKTSSVEYQAGVAAGNQIGLDPQAGNTARKRLT